VKDRIVLSHKTQNKPVVRLYCDGLQAAGFRPWLDAQEMHAGDSPDEGIIRAFKESCAVVFFLTPEFKVDKFLKDEIRYAKVEEREKGDRFRLISLMVPQNGKPGTANVPDLLKPYLRIEKASHLASLTEIIKALPVRLGASRWKTEPEEPDAALKRIKGKIITPADNNTVSPGRCRVSGVVAMETYNQQALYLFTGEADRFWPSARIVPNPEGHWHGEVNLGRSYSTGTIRFVAVDSNLAEYIEVYRSQAGYMKHSGMVIPRFPAGLDRIRVRVSLPKK